MRAAKPAHPARRVRKDRVAHIRFSPEEFSAIEASAARAGLTVSAFVRSLSLEGAGVAPFLNDADRAILATLGQDLGAIGRNLNQVARALNAEGSVRASDVAGRIDDARAAAMTIAAELAHMTRRAGASRRREAA